jgi:hypothetical protein
VILVFTVEQAQIGTHSFTFDHVYGSGGSPSSSMFEECVAPLVDGLFQGYNATVLAYGQVIVYPMPKKKQNALSRPRPLIISCFLLGINTYLCCRQDLGKHIPWGLASRMVATQD